MLLNLAGMIVTLASAAMPWCADRRNLTQEKSADGVRRGTTDQLVTGPAGKWLSQRLAANHAPILGRQGNPNHQYMAFCAFVAVAPSNSPTPLSLVDLMDGAHDFTHRCFPGVFPNEPDYAGHELVRYEAPPANGTGAQNRIIFYPTGLVELHWVLATPPALQLPLDELVDVVSRLHAAVASGAFQRLHRPRRWERRRKVDWRIGVNAWAATSDNSVHWEKVGPSELAPPRRDVGRRPSCPSEGYAAGELSSRRPKTKLRYILTPALVELLAAGGYSGGDEIRASAARYVDQAEVGAIAQPNPNAIISPPDSGAGPSVEASAPAALSPQRSVGSVTADEVIEAFRAVGLPVPNPRDNSHNCSSLGCSQMITTDAVTVVVFDDEAAAERYAAAAREDKCLQGLVVLSYAAARTVPKDRSQYEHALNTLLTRTEPIGPADD